MSLRLPARNLRLVSRFLHSCGIRTEYHRKDRSLSLFDDRDIGGGFNITESRIVVHPHGNMDGTALREEYGDVEWHRGLSVIVSGWEKVA